MNRILNVIIITLIIGIYSCENNIQKNETENNSEILVDTIIPKIDAIKIEKDSSLYQFITNQLKEYKLVNEDKNNKLFVLENSNFTKSEYAYIKKQSTINYGDIEGIYPKANFFLYSYSDTLVCKNSFKEWLKSIGDDSEIKLMENKNAVKTPPIFALKSSYEIFVLYYLCEHQEDNWKFINDKMKDFFGDKDFIIMNIECGGPLTWN